MRATLGEHPCPALDEVYTDGNGPEPSAPLGCPAGYFWALLCPLAGGEQATTPPSATSGGSSGPAFVFFRVPACLTGAQFVVPLRAATAAVTLPGSVSSIFRPPRFGR